MTTLFSNLQKNIQGDVKQSGLSSYQTDESIFTLSPQVVVCPKDEADVKTVVEIASEHKIPITARGGGSGIAGQSIGSGIILDFSTYLNRILDISKTSVIAEAGVVLGNLNQEAARFGSKFGPDPGSWDRCTVGGIISTNAAGPHALMYGSTRDHVQSLKLVLANANAATSDQLSKDMSSYATEISKHAELIQKTKRNVDKNSSGYYLEAFLSPKPALEKLIVGSEGTLAMVTEATLGLVPMPEKISFAIFGFESMGKALMSVKALRESKACCIELLDQTILNVIKKENSNFINEMGLENSKASLWVEWCGDISADWKQKSLFNSSDAQSIQRIWNQRSAVSKLLHAQAASQNRKPLRCIEDACVPIDELITYVMEVNDLLERHDCMGAIFGHVGNGHLHINPSIRTDLPKLAERVRKLTDEFYDLVIGLGGTLSGEHGDGILRVPYAKKQWKEIWPLFEFVKKSFDPKGIFNPDKKVPVGNFNWPELKY